MRLYPDRGVGVVVMANTTRRYDFEPLFGLLAVAASTGVAEDFRAPCSGVRWFCEVIITVT